MRYYYNLQDAPGIPACDTRTAIAGDRPHAVPAHACIICCAPTWATVQCTQLICEHGSVNVQRVVVGCVSGGRDMRGVTSERPDLRSSNSSALDSYFMGQSTSQGKVTAYSNELACPCNLFWPGERLFACACACACTLAGATCTAADFYLLRGRP